MFVKICGLRREIDIDYVNELKPDFIGFIFAPNKVRTVNPEFAKILKDKLDKDIKAVGVFRNNDLNDIKKVLDLNIIDLIQLHGDEDDEYIINVKKMTNLPIIKAYRNSEYADYILFDNMDPGKGNMFDWNIIDRKKPFFLAGGISIDNIDIAIKQKPYCIDVSSGVETSGFKDYDKMKELIRRCRNE